MYQILRVAYNYNYLENLIFQRKSQTWKKFLQI